MKVKKKCQLAVNKVKEARKNVKKCLYAYPVLKENIERYKKDIEDIKHEDLEHSKSIVFLNPVGQRLTIEEKREAKIFSLQQAIEREQAAIDKLDKAMREIESEKYYPALPLIFFERMSQMEVSIRLYCDRTTLWRQVGRLLDILAIHLYGADAIEI